MSPTSSPTLQELADHLGLAKSTVSLALRDRGTLSVATRARVKAAAKDIGYRPDPLLAALVSRREGRRADGVPLCFLSSEPASSTRAFQQGATQRAEALGYALSSERIREPRDLPILLRRLWHQGCRGLILHHIPAGPWLELPQVNDMALIQCRQGLDVLPLTTVRSGILQKTQATYARVIDAGYRRIGSIVLLSSADGSHPEDVARVGGALGAEFRFREVCEFCEPLMVHPAGRSPAAWAKAARQWLRREKPEALVFTVSRLQSLLFPPPVRIPPAAYTLVIPQDIPGAAFAGMCDNNPELGAKCVEMLDQLVRTHQFGVPAHSFEVVIPSQWMDGGSLPPALSAPRSRGRRRRRAGG